MPSSLLLDIQAALVTLALLTPRALVCLSIMNGFGMRTLPRLMRTGVAIAIALPASLPTYTFVQETPPDYLLAGVLSIKEAAIGLILGVMMAIPLWVAESIGGILDMQRSPIQITANNKSIENDASLIGSLLLQAVLLVMIEAGLFVALTRIIIESYGIWPVQNLAPPYEPGQLTVMIKRFSEFFWHVIVYGAPVLIPLLLIDFAFAILGVFAPQLPVSFAASPIKSITGMFIILVYWPTFSHYVTGDFSHMLEFLATMVQAGGKP